MQQKLLLNKKLYEDNTFNDLKDKQFFKSKGEKRREQKKHCIKQINNIKENKKQPSRQQHAKRRERNGSGRFVSKPKNK